MLRKLGNTDEYVSAIGLGTQQIGGGSWWGTHDDNASIRTIHAALDSGINLIDSAPLYGFGHAETIVGKALKGRKRDTVLVSTKCGLWWHSRQKNFAFVVDHKKVYKCLTKSCIEQEIDMSLARLQIDYIDIYHIHVPDDTADKSEVGDCLNTLQKKGKIHYVAVSNMSMKQCEEYDSICTISANQIKRNLLEPLTEKENRFYKRNKISVLAYAPLEQGLLTGKVNNETVLAKTDYRQNNYWFCKENRSKVLAVLTGWADLLEKYQCSLPQLVLAHTIHTEGITTVLCGSGNEQHIQESAAASEIVLEEQDKNRMDNEMNAIRPANK